MTPRRSDAWRVATNVPLVIGALGIALIAVLAMFGPYLAPSDPQAQRVIIFYPGGTFAAPPTPPDRWYPLGTDPLGRDQLARLLWGARLTLTVVLLGLAGRAAVGVTLGLLAGWRRGGWLDGAVTYVTNAFAGIPQLMLALLVVIALQPHGVTGFIAALAFVGWAELAQFVRAETARTLAAAHVEAARAIGGTARHVARTHVLRDLAPQLLGVLALEAGSVLLLLAELGFIGFFISGGVFYTDDAGRPILPVRDRAPEWGQMLAGARHYAFAHQYVAFVPGVVVAGAVLTFGLFAEGLRGALDPFGRHRLSPRTLGHVARVALAALLIGAAGLGYASVRSTAVSFAEGMRLAQASAERVVPGAHLMAGVIRFASSEHGIAKPAKLNYYFRAADGTILRVGIVSADANAVEVQRFSHEDDINFDLLRPLGEAPVAWEDAFATAERAAGRAFRDANPQYTVRIVLAQEHDAPVPSYRVRYFRPFGAALIDLRVDATTGALGGGRPQIEDARSRAREALGGEVALVGTGAVWNGERSTAVFGTGAPGGFGVARPLFVSYTFARRDVPADTRLVTVRYDGRTPQVPTVASGGGLGGASASRAEIRPIDVPALLERVEAAGGRAVRETWGDVETWSILANTREADGRTFAYFTYQSARSVATFRMDPASGQVERVPG